MKNILILFFLIPLLAKSQLFVGQNVVLHISDGAKLEVGGDLENEGIIENFGTLALYSNWTQNNNFNGLEGELEFLGDENQIIAPPNLNISSLIVNSLGAIRFPGNEYVISDRLEFRFGTIEVGDETRFIIGEEASVIGGSNQSYINGPIISRGSGIKTFPVGSDGVYSPLTLLDVFGNDVEIQTTYTRDNPVDPVPGDSLLGVSHRGFWEVELINGVSDDSQVQIEFSEDDLSDFRIRNNIRHQSNVPTIAFTENLTNRWQSLGTSDIVDSDSLTFGTITSEFSVPLEVGSKIYFSVGLAPRVPDGGLFFVPEVFSPNALDIDNRSFKVFGERISNENFNFQIYNRLGVRVYSTNSFIEANENGWDGTNPSGAEEPTGVYFYSVRVELETGRVIEESGAFWLVR